MSVRSDLMVQQYRVAKELLNVAISNEYEDGHDVSSHAIAEAIYRIDGNKTEGITVKDRIVVYGYILARIEQGDIASAENPDELIGEVNRLFVEFVEDFEASSTQTEDFAKPLSGVAMALVELLDVTREVAEETDGILPNSHGLATETIADYVQLTRESEELYNLKEEIERA